MDTLKHVFIKLWKARDELAGSEPTTPLPNIEFEDADLITEEDRLGDQEDALVDRFQDDQFASLQNKGARS